MTGSIRLRWGRQRIKFVAIQWVRWDDAFPAVLVVGFNTETLSRKGTERDRIVVLALL